MVAGRQENRVCQQSRNAFTDWDLCAWQRHAAVRRSDCLSRHAAKMVADGSQLAFISLTGSGGGFFSGQTQPWAIFVWDVASGKAKQIWQSANDANGSFPGGEWQRDAFQFAAGNRIVFASQAEVWVHLYSISAEGGT